MLRAWSVVGLVVLLFGEFTCATGVAQSPQPASADGVSRSQVSDTGGGDLFARLRTTRLRASDAYWQQFGRALSRMGKLEGATYDPDSGAVLLVGQPADSYGPYDLDDLMVVLKAKLFHLEPLGMTIDPDPANPRGPKQFVRYFAGCQDTGCGWVMFECDRLLKCFSQGKDNLTGEPMDPEVEGFGTLLERAVASGRPPPQDRWNRFWLDVDIHNHEAGERPKTSNGTQPLARVTADGSSMRLVHCRVYLRTEMMKLAGGKFVTAEGEKSPEAEQFAIHFCNEYEEFSRRYPVFAQLEAISHLIALSDWMIEQRIPLDVDYIAAYRQRVPVQTPTWTPAITAELNVATPVPGGIQRALFKSLGGVSLSAKVFQAVDNGSAKTLGDEGRKGQSAHRSDAGWTQKDSDGTSKFVAALTTLNARYQGAGVDPTRSVELRKSGDRPSSTPADLPYRPTFADSDRDVLTPNVQISISRLKDYREQLPRGPPDVLVFGDQRHLAEADRTIDVPRIDVPLPKEFESNPNVKPQPPPDQFRADAERTPLENQSVVPLTSRSEVRQLGLAVFETPSGTRTLNLPKLVRWNNPAKEQRGSVEGVPGTEIAIADQLALVSELGDIMVSFGETQVDQTRLQLFHPTQPPGQYGVQGYYPQSSTLHFVDGAHIKFNASDFPQQVKTANGTTVDLHYMSPPAGYRKPNWPVVEKCTVVASTAEAESGEFALLASPATEKPADESPVAPPVTPITSAPTTIVETASTAPSIEPPKQNAPSAIELRTRPEAGKTTEIPVSFAGGVSGEIRLDPPIILGSRDHAGTWTARLKSGKSPSATSADSSEAGETIHLADERGRRYEVVLANNSGTLAAGEVASIPLLLRPVESPAGAGPVTTSTHLTVELQFTPQDGSAPKYVSIPLHLVPRNSNGASTIVWAGLLGMVLVASLVFIFLRLNH
jgi:hypothetical protein